MSSRPKEFVAYAKANKEEMQFASAGTTIAPRRNISQKSAERTACLESAMHQ
jgi:hypothetical protein